MRIHKRRTLIRRSHYPFVFLLFLPALLHAQDKTELQQVLERLDRLEQQNRSLVEEVHALRKEVAALNGSRGDEEKAEAPKTEQAPVEEQVAVLGHRTDELAETKVETSQRFPIKLTGMALVNAFTNSKYSGGSDYPLVASRTAGYNQAGGTIRQSVIGLEFHGPGTFGGGKVSGSLFMDFYGGSGEALDQAFRVRTGSINIDWKNTSLMAGQEKPIIAPREPDSLAQVGISPLTGAGNLWLWGPQVRLEQRFHLADTTSIRAQVGVYQVNDGSTYVPSYYYGSLEEYRPGFEGRFELAHRFGNGSRLEIAPGFHVSTSHIGAVSVPSRAFSLDWFMNPWKYLEFTGAFFHGQNLSGMGGLHQGFTPIGSGQVIPVHGTGGWGQFTFLATQRLSFNFFGGQEDDRNSDLLAGRIAKNQSYGANLMYKIAPNVIVSLENARVWTTYLGDGTRRNSHYDLALAYLF